MSGNRECAAGLLIALVGPKHSGKSAAGRELARILGLPFVDLDSLIEERTGKSPRELYTMDKELFRREEAEALGTLLKPGAAGRPGEMVIAAGGGIIDNPASAGLFLNRGVIKVCLELSAGSAWTRIARTGELPPFLRCDNPREQHRLLHERRTGAYRKTAAFTVNAEAPPPVVAEEIALKLKSLKK